jgi:hypothetical protein
MKLSTFIWRELLFACFLLLASNIEAQTGIKDLAKKLKVDGSIRHQRIDGIGVNANTSSWNGKDLEPALDLLLDSMHTAIWRVIVESVEKWEEVNDNNDPFSFDWNYYNKLYETPKFQKVWNMIAYLNGRGITDNLMINFMGFAPQWMGIKVIEPKYEDEFVEMLVSFFYYAIKTKHLKIGLIAPTNESDWYNYAEGPHLNGKQHARIIRKMIDRMDALNIMGKIRIVGPDVVVFDNATKSYIPALMEDSIIWPKIAHLSFHSYGGYSYDIMGYIKNSPHPETTYWVSEWNAWCDGCDDGKKDIYNYSYARKSVRYLFEFLKNNATGCIAFEGYDSYYEHHAPSPFSYWGLLEYRRDSKTYLPRKTFYAIAQVSKFVLPGFQRITVSGEDSCLIVLAFHESVSRKLNIVGMNMRRTVLSLDVALANLPEFKHFDLVYTDSTSNLRRASTAGVKENSFKVSIPPNCIFALSGTMK